MSKCIYIYINLTACFYRATFKDREAAVEESGVGEYI